MSTQPGPRGTPRKSGAERTRRWRQRLRAKGLAPRTVWIYDVRDPVFAARLKADMERLQDTPEEAEMMQEFLDAAVEDGQWDEDGWEHLLEANSSSS